ncbi:MAG: NAD-dependent protein deacylase [Promethearchaeota archaeon]
MENMDASKSNDLESLLDKAAELIVNSKYLVVLTGAGISTESGVPDFRSPNDGLWTKISPEETKNLFRDPKVFWKLIRIIGPKLMKAKPNPAHKILAKWQKKKIVKTIITQNIDGLHQAAGSDWVLELHGDAREFRCVVCHSRFDSRKIIKAHKPKDDNLPPICPQCGGNMILEVILFGQNLPEGIWMESVSDSKKADVFIVVGSSLVVYPANQLPVYAKKSKGKVIIINNSPTDFDAFADIVLRGQCSTILMELDKRIEKLKNRQKIKK